jgi:hypothetical protein
LARHVARIGERRGIYRIWVGKPEGKDNIKMDLQEVECRDMDWIELAEDRDR